MNNKAMYNLSYGLFVLTARENEKDNGCIVNTVAQVTTSPNRILVAVNKNNYTHGMILRTGEFNVSILTERAAFNTFKHWGFQSGSDVDKAVGITFRRADNQLIYLAEDQRQSHLHHGSRNTYLIPCRCNRRRSIVR